MGTLSRVNQQQRNNLSFTKSSFKDMNSILLTGRELRREKRKKARNK